MDFNPEIKFRGYDMDHTPAPQELDWAAKILAEAERPLIMAGGGVIAAGATNELVALSEALLAPTANTLMGKGAFPDDHPLSLGLCGMHGTQASNSLVPNADVLLVVGSRFSDRTTAKVADFNPNGKVIHIDIDRSEINKNVETVTRVVGDAKLALAGLLERVKVLKNKPSADWSKRIEEFQMRLEPRGRHLKRVPACTQSHQSTKRTTTEGRHSHN